MKTSNYLEHLYLDITKMHKTRGRSQKSKFSSLCVQNM